MYKESLNEAELTSGLNTRFIGRRALVYQTVSSTMDVARQEALRKAPEGTAVIAEQQTAGRGRLKRAWQTPVGNIAVSIILYPPAHLLHSLIMLSSLAVLYTIEEVTGLACELKWPNDVLIGGKKVSGILIETKAQADRLDYAILGIGINVNMKLADFPELQPIATSLADALGKPVSRISLLQRLFAALERLYTDLLSGKSLFTEWRASLSTLGKQVHVIHGNDTLEGTAESVLEDGSLLLRYANGTLKRITIGDVSLHEQIEGG